MTLRLVLLADGRLEGLLLLGGPLLAAGGDVVAPNLRQHIGRLIAAHHRDAGVRPDEEEARAEGAPAHAVVARAETAADQHRQLRYRRRRHRRHHLGAVLGDAAGLVLPADHEPGDVLQENQRNAPLCAEFDEMRALECRFREQDAIVGDDADRITVEPGEAADQRDAVERLELVELAAIDQARDHLSHIIGFDAGPRARCREISVGS